MKTKLTEEILDKYGEKYFYGHCIENNDLEVVIDLVSKRTSLETINECHIVFIKHLEYLEDLQTLWKLITGEELKEKENV